MCVNFFWWNAEHIKSHVQVTESLLESTNSMSSNRKSRLQLSIHSFSHRQVLSRSILFFRYFLRAPFILQGNDISTVLSSRTDRTELKYVNRPLSLRIRYQPLRLIIGSFALSHASIWRLSREYSSLFSNANIRERKTYWRRLAKSGGLRN